MEIIGRVVEKLGPLIRKEVELHLNSDQEAKTLADNLENIQLLLDDAERKQLDQPPVKKWLQDLQNLAYDIEDALEDWEAQNQALQQQEEASNVSPTTIWMEKVCHFLHCPCSCFNKVVERRTVALDIKGLNESVVGMYTKGVDQLKLIQLFTSLAAPDKAESVGGSSSYNWRTTTSDFIKSEVHGRKNDVKNVKKMLLTGDDVNGKEEVVCIVGAGGIGKTTLAKMIYYDDEVASKFPTRIWVCVSDPFNELAIAREIYEQLEGHSPTVSGLESIKNGIKKFLREKSEKFLLVLDDVWIHKSEEWKSLQACLSHGAKESKILVTTRNEDTAKAVGATKNSTYFLQKMSSEDCWSIIHQKAFQGNEVNPGLESIGREIAKKCDGSPLAASFLGDHLRDKTTMPAWKRVQESEVWELKNVENDLFRHFFLSYNELKLMVKRCFAYCAMFPKGSLIKIAKLVRIWKALGFASSSSASLETELDCFKDLAQRSFFQDLEKDELTGERILFCKMHDIVHDFAQYLNTTARHLWWNHKLQQSISISDVEKLRSLHCEYGLLAEDIIGRLKSVRALSLCECGLENIPHEIGNLIRLRYLDLSYNDMTELPETICNLRNLQTLILVGCEKVSKLPKGISKLQNLRYFIFRRVVDFIQEFFRVEKGFDLTSEIASLTDLQHLEIFEVGKGCNNLGYLKDLNQLGTLLIRLRDMDDVESAKTAALWEKKNLDILLLDYNEGVKLQVVDALGPLPQLQTLIISFTGLELPNWIWALQNLRSLFFVSKEISSKLEEDPIARCIFFLKNTRNMVRNKSNWGTFENLLDFYYDLLKACISHLKNEISQEDRRFPSLITFLENITSLSTYLKNLSTEILEEDLRDTSLITALENFTSEIMDFQSTIRVEDPMIIPTDYSSFPPLWKLPFLENFWICGDYYAQRWVGHAFYSFVSSHGDDEELVLFPALKTLVLGRDYFWKAWNEMEKEKAAANKNIIIMPLLTDLKITSCINLESLPERTLQQLPSLRTLRIDQCPKLKSKYGGDAWTPKFDVIFT